MPRSRLTATTPFDIDGLLLRLVTWLRAHSPARVVKSRT